MIRRLWRLALAASTGMLFGLAVAAPASAHATLARTDPPANAVLASAPASITLTFTEPVRPVAERIRVVAPDRSRADSGAPTVSGSSLTIPLRRDGVRGTYLVSFRVISTDSHPIGGSFTFSIGAPSADPPSAAGTDTRRADPVVAVAVGAARYLGYAGLVLLAGPLLFLTRLWPRRLSRRVPARMLAAGLGILAFGTVAEMYLQAPYTSGSSLFGASGEALSAALSGPFGTTHAVRLAVLAAIAVLMRPFVRAEGPSTVDLAVLSFLGVVGIGTWPLSGHPTASPAPAVSLLADAAHLAAMAFWLGGLVVLVGVLLRRATGGELAAILPVWSSWALLAVVVLAMTGLAQSIIEVGTVSALFDTTYGRLVIAKAALLALVVTVAWFSRRMVNRRFAPAAGGAGGAAGGASGGAGGASGGAGGASGGVAGAVEPPVGPLRRSVLVELAVTGVVLGLAAALVQTPPARTAEADVPQPYVVTLSTELYRVRVELDPAAVGPNSLHLYAFNQAGAPQRVVEWRVTAQPVGGGIEPLTVPLLPVTEDHAVAEVTFQTAGQWELRLTLRLSDVDQATVSHQVAISD